MKKNENIKRLFLLIITTYLFILSIKLMGNSFKLFGKDFADGLISFTDNPLVGLFIGLLATSVVQSSSATTSIIVGLTASDALTIANAIPMIMGANIGTSITNTLVSMAHITRKQEFIKAFAVATVHDFFNLLVVLVLFPLEVYFHIIEKSALFITQFFVGSNFSLQFINPLDMIINPIASQIQFILMNKPTIILILSLTMLFFSLKFFVDLMKPIAESEFRHVAHKHIFAYPWRTFGLGLLVTMTVQSSSVSTSLIVPLAGIGIVTLETIFPYILGANVGTTITALLAALITGSPVAVTVAVCHTLFNVFGSVIMYPLRRIPINISTGLAKLCIKSRILPIAYISVVFYAVPIMFVLFFH